jgi:hypothetical protein
MSYINSKSRNNTNSVSTSALSPINSARPSVFVSTEIGSRKLSPKKIILREGGMHRASEKLMVMESDRTSPMMRSIQS